jgi:hypothetical protein
LTTPAQDARADLPSGDPRAIRSRLRAEQLAALDGPAFDPLRDALRTMVADGSYRALVDSWGDPDITS